MVRTPRTLLVPDHLWQVFQQMAAEMGSDLDGLVNQALFAFARRNGYLVPGALREPPRREGEGEGEGETADHLGAPDEPAPASSRGAGPLEARAAKRSRKSGFAAARPAAAGSEGARPASAAKGPLSGKPRTLVLLADGREIDRIVKSRFVIGRGKHCDLVIQSGKVSREHAAISREGDAWFIEDLNSSNGTWFDQRRITRRQIREGDEYFISAERLSCVFR